MQRTRYEVLPIPEAERTGINRWQATQDGKRMGVWPRKVDAVKFTVSLAKGRWLMAGMLGTLKIKGRNGRIQDERTYGRDPRNIPG